MSAAAGWVAYTQTAAGFQLMAYEATTLTGVTSAFATEVIALEMALDYAVGLIG